LHCEHNKTEHSNSTSTNWSSTIHSGTNNITQAIPVPKETVNEKALPTEATGTQTAAVLDDSGTAALKGIPESTINDSGSRLVSNQDDTTNSTHNLHALIMSQGDQTVPIVLDRLENEEHVSPENNTIQSTGVQDDAATHLIIPTLVGTSAFLHYALRGSVR
jgi:hypothetical protein